MGGQKDIKSKCLANVRCGGRAVVKLAVVAYFICSVQNLCIHVEISENSEG